MSNLHNEFGTFHDKVALSPGKKASLRTSRDAVRERIRNFFREGLEVEAPKFHAQGSYAMGTTVNPLNGEFDIDDGVYLQHLDRHDSTKWPTPDTVHKWLITAVDGQTDEQPVDKRTCVRVLYTGRYHVDLPSYAMLNGEFLLAEKGEAGWHRSDPKALADWFKRQVRQRGEQLRRVVRYLKAWADYQAGKRGTMPSSLILTVLATEHFCPSDRDDVSLSNTATAIRNAVKPVFCVRNPVDPAEELTSRLEADQKTRFQKAISELADDSVTAVASTNTAKASRLWRGQLGDRFPLIEDASEDPNQKKEDAKRLAAVFIAKNPAKPWAYTT